MVKDPVDNPLDFNLNSLISINFNFSKLNLILMMLDQRDLSVRFMERLVT